MGWLAALVADEQTGTKKRFVEDDGGVILVVGVFFTFLWIGTVWFLFGLGNVIAYRENMQNAADASAFAAAVYNARGMNMLAMINNLMGIVLATLIVMKFAQIANMFAKGADCHSSESSTESCCADIYGCTETFCAPDIIETVATCISDCNNVMDFQSKISNFDKGVHAALNGMHTAETLIAKGWPFIAAGKSQTAGTTPNFYAMGVTSTNSVSYSENPNSVDPSDGVASPATDTCPSFSGGGTTSDGECAMGPRCGLPVTSDHYSTLCHVAMDDYTTAGGALPSSVTSVTKYVSLGWYDFGAQWFCDDDSPTGIPGLANMLFTTVGTVAMSFAAFWECAAVGGVEGAVRDILGGGGATNGNLSLIPMSGPKIPNTCPAWSPMAIYAPAKMGLDYYGVWATAKGVWKGDGSHKDFAANEVQVAGIEAKSGNKVVVNPPSDADTAVSRAEFYYEPAGSNPGAVQSDDTVDHETVFSEPAGMLRNVLWNMRWRARLRRFHFMPGVGASLGMLPGNAGVTDEVLYIAAVAQDTALVAAMALNGSLSSPTTSVDSQSNGPPVGMFH